MNRVKSQTEKGHRSTTERWVRSAEDLQLPGPLSEPTTRGAVVNAWGGLSTRGPTFSTNRGSDSFPLRTGPPLELSRYCCGICQPTIKSKPANLSPGNSVSFSWRLKAFADLFRARLAAALDGASLRAAAAAGARRLLDAERRQEAGGRWFLVDNQHRPQIATDICGQHHCSGTGSKAHTAIKLWQQHPAAAPAPKLQNTHRPLFLFLK